MQVGLVLISCAMVALSTWGYLATFAVSAGSVSGRVFTPLLPFTWVDSRRSNPDGTLETPVGFIDGRPPTALEVASPQTAVALTSSPKIVRSISRKIIPLPERGVRLLASVPLPERVLRSQDILTAQWLPVRRPDPDLPAARVAESARTTGVDIVRDVKTASIAGPVVVIVQEAVRQTASRPMMDLVTGSIARRPDFEGRQALGGPRPIEIEPVAVVKNYGKKQPLMQAELPELLPIRAGSNALLKLQPIGSATRLRDPTSEFVIRAASPELVQISLRTEKGGQDVDAKLSVADRPATSRGRASTHKTPERKSARSYQQRRNRSMANSIRQARRARGVY